MTGSSPIRIFTLDDHPLVREGISGLVGVQPDMKAIVQAIANSPGFCGIWRAPRSVISTSALRVGLTEVRSRRSSSRDSLV
jgi:hypothetical protein